MPGSTSARRIVLALLLWVPVAGSPGCAIGGLHQAARRVERPVRIDAAHLQLDTAHPEQARLWLIYTAEASNAHGQAVGRFRRGVMIALAELDPARLHAIDAVPLERVPPRQITQLGLPRLRILQPGEALSVAEPQLVVVERDDRLLGFRVERLELAAEGAHLDADSLTRRWLAVWTPLLWPAAFAYDLVALPVLFAFAGPYFGLSK